MKLMSPWSVIQVIVYNNKVQLYLIGENLLLNSHMCFNDVDVHEALYLE